MDPVTLNSIDVFNCYLLFLGRPPESCQVILEKMKFSPVEVVKGFVGSDEFQNYVALPLVARGVIKANRFAGVASDAFRLWVQSFTARLGHPTDIKMSSSWRTILKEVLGSNAIADIVHDVRFEPADVVRGLSMAGGDLGNGQPSAALLQLGHSKLVGLSAIRDVIENVFDHVFYDRQRLGDISSLDNVRQEAVTAHFYKEIDGLTHFLIEGAYQGLDPTEKFSSSFYLRQTPLLLKAELNPFYDYLSRGMFIGRIPAPLLDSMGHKELDNLHSPTAKKIVKQLFDFEFYRVTNADLELAISMTEVDPIDHYMEFGWLESRDPSPDFSTRAYLSKYPEVMRQQINPLLHYICWGKAAGMNALVRASEIVAELDETYEFDVGNDIRSGLVEKFAYQSAPPASYRPERLQIHFVIPDFGVGGGGHMTIFRIVHWLEFFGHHCTIWVVNRYAGRSDDERTQDVIQHYQVLRARVISVDESFGSISGDAIFATSWDTVSSVADHAGFDSRFYLIQDNEIAFNPVGSRTILTESTYYQDIVCICASPWLKAMMIEKYGRKSHSFHLAADEHYKLASSPNQRSGGHRIAFYARVHTPRRAVELGLLALERLARTGLQFEVHAFGSPTPMLVAPFPLIDHGVLDASALNALYQKCDIGICFSATNYSLVPQEMMASGLPVMELEGGSTRAVYPEGVVTFCGPEPADICDQISQILLAPEQRLQQSLNAHKWINGFGWEDSSREIERIVLAEIEESGVKINEIRVSPLSIYASVVIPTYNGGGLLIDVVKMVLSQRCPWNFELIIIDSASTDGVIKTLEESYPQIVFRHIRKTEFQHGRTRNLGVDIARGEFVAFLTQDAKPTDQFWLYNLITTLARFPLAAGAYGRHVAHSGASVYVERDINDAFKSFAERPLIVSRYLDEGRWLANDTPWRQFLHFYSDNNSALRKSVWMNIPLPEVDYGEDQAWANLIIDAGYDKVYAPSAVVYHSHDYDPDETRERARVESQAFSLMFKYNLAPSNPELFIREANARDYRWGVSHGVSAEKIRAKMALNVAQVSGWLEGRHLTMIEQLSSQDGQDG